MGEYMCNRTVYPDLLVNDLDFWLEANIFQKQVDQYLEQENLGNMPCNKHLFKKMNLISSCYLRSHIPPNIRINTDHQMAQATVVCCENLDIIDRSVFHDITLQLFPVLIQHWSRFCNKKYAYNGKTSLYNDRLARTLKRRDDFLKQKQIDRIKSLKKRNCKGASQYTTPSSTAKTMNTDGSGDFSIGLGEQIASPLGIEKTDFKNYMENENPVLSFSVSKGQRWNLANMINPKNVNDSIWK